MFPEEGYSLHMISVKYVNFSVIIIYKISEEFDEEVEVYSSNVDYDEENPEYLNLNEVTDIDEAIKELIRNGFK